MFNQKYCSMKKIILAAVVALFATFSASAQDSGQWGVGPQVGIYTNTGWSGAVLGVGVQGRYAFADNWRVQPAITAILKKFCSVDISADVQYLFDLTPGWKIYPQAGLSANDLGDWSCGVNLGAGTDFSLTPDWDLSAGFKWMIQTHRYWKNPIIINIGATYKF